MGDFSQIRDRLDIRKARLLTDQEADTSFPRVSKYRTLLKSRPITKVPVNIVLPAFTNGFIIYWYGQLAYQYNVSAPRDFYIKRVQNPDGLYGILCVKWRVGTQVHRYMLYPYENQELYKFDAYDKHLVKKNCCFELWGIFSPIVTKEVIIETSLLDLPNNVDDVGHIYPASAYYNREAMGQALPENIPTDQTNIAWLDNV